MCLRLNMQTKISTSYKSIFPRYAYLSVILTGILLSGVLISMLISQHVIIWYVSDPFKAYTPILPGQPLNELAAFDCRPIEERTNAQFIKKSSACILLPQNDIIHLLNIKSQNDRIMELTFYTSNLSVVNLMSWWGIPRMERIASQALLEWDSTVYDYKIYAHVPHFRFADEVNVVTMSLR